jgi:hypothetical protein
MSATHTTALPDYAPVPRPALGAALNEQGYYAGRAGQNLCWITYGTYRAAFFANSAGAVLLDAPRRPATRSSAPSTRRIVTCCPRTTAHDRRNRRITDYAFLANDWNAAMSERRISVMCCPSTMAEALISIERRILSMASRPRLRWVTYRGAGAKNQRQTVGSSPPSMTWLVPVR